MLPYLSVCNGRIIRSVLRPPFFRTRHRFEVKRLAQKYETASFYHGCLMKQILVQKALRGSFYFGTTNFKMSFYRSCSELIGNRNRECSNPVGAGSLYAATEFDQQVFDVLQAITTAVFMAFGRCHSIE